MKPSKGKKGVITWQAMKINKEIYGISWWNLFWYRLCARHIVSYSFYISLGRNTLHHVFRRYTCNNILTYPNASTQFICSLQRQKDRRVWYILYSSWYCIDDSRYLQNTLILKIPQQFCHYKGAEVLFTHSQFIFQDHVWNGNRNRKRVLMTFA